MMKFNTSTSMQALARVVDFLVLNEGATLAQVAAGMGWPEHRTGEYLRQAHRMNLARKLPRPRRVGHRSGLCPLQWAAVQRKYSHDPLMAALFGAARPTE